MVYPPLNTTTGIKKLTNMNLVLMTDNSCPLQFLLSLSFHKGHIRNDCTKFFFFFFFLLISNRILLKEKKPPSTQDVLRMHDCTKFQILYLKEPCLSIFFKEPCLLQCEATSALIYCITYLTSNNTKTNAYDSVANWQLDSVVTKDL